MWTTLCVLGSSLLLTFVFCSDDYSKDKYPKEKKEVDKHFFGGLYPGKCTRNGVYIRNAYSLVFCSNRNKYVQPCAPGTRNGPLHAYLPGAKYGPTDFCNVNLVPYGDAPYMYPILQYGGLPLPFRHTRKDGYLPYLFLPRQIYPRREEPYKSKAVKSGYLQPLDGYKVVETIKDTHLYEKPDAVHGFHHGHHNNALQKDYHAIKESYKLREKADQEFKEAYKEVDKEINDDYMPEYKNEFEKFAKNYNGYDRNEHEYKMDIKYDSYDAPNKKYNEKYEKKEKKMKYKQTRYEPPKPNKYGEIKDLPPKYKKSKTYESSKYDSPGYDTPKYESPKDDSAKYEDDGYDESPPKYDTSYEPPTYDPPKHDDRKYDSGKYESPPFESSKKVYKTIDENDREFNLFYNSNGHAHPKIKGATYSDDTFGEYAVGHVEKSTDIVKPKKPYSAPLKEEIHGSHYIQQ